MTGTLEQPVRINIGSSGRNNRMWQNRVGQRNMIAVARCDAFSNDSLGGRHFEGRDLILQVTKSCQCRNRIATSLKDSFTFGGLRADERTREASDSISPGNGRQHRAWGASPRIKIKKAIEPAKAGDRRLTTCAVARSAGSIHFF